jgi:hypothetical protein
VIAVTDAFIASYLQVSMRQQDFQAFHWQAMTLLWRQQLLCDVQLKASSGELLAAHSVVLASASGFFRCGCALVHGLLKWLLSVVWDKALHAYVID